MRARVGMLNCMLLKDVRVMSYCVSCGGAEILALRGSCPLPKA